MRCAHCDSPITKKVRFTQEVGWAKDRKDGGVNALKLRRSTGKVLCDDCGSFLFVTGRMRNLIPEGQLTLT
jgi:DNA-directed RNA polymerase subunit RPC12/RpoP